MTDSVIIDNTTQVAVSEAPDVQVVEVDNSTIVVFAQDEITVVESENSSIVVSPEQATVVVTVGSQGPAGPIGIQGPKGDPGSGSNVDISVLTEQMVSSHRVMTVDSNGFAIYADSSNPQHMQGVLGLSINAVTDNSYVTIRTSGYLEEPGWNWTPYIPIFLSTNGNLTQVPPTAGFSVIVATVLSPTKILINIKESIALT